MILFCEPGNVLCTIQLYIAVLQKLINARVRISSDLWYFGVRVTVTTTKQ